MSEPIKFKEQLALLKMATLHTGVIHDAQKLQLTRWPELIPNVKPGVVTKVDPEKKLVIYECKTSNIKITPMIKLYFTNITAWTRQLLWDETTVIFKMNGKVVHDSRS